MGVIGRLCTVIVGLQILTLIAAGIYAWHEAKHASGDIWDDRKE